MNFSAWSLFIDVGLISILLLVGVILRAKIVWVQKMFLPASVIAGFLGLLLGPNGLSILPFSQAIGQYPGILIAVVFGALPLVAPKINFNIIRDRIGGMWAYSTIISLLQWGGGLLFALWLINPVWTSLPDGFGLVLASGFVGGHGTAAAVGEIFANAGWADARSLAMTSATVGIVCSIGLGVIFIKNGSNKGETEFLSSFSKLPTDLKTGLIPVGQRQKTESNTFSSIVIDPLIVHVALIAAIAFGGYLITKGVNWINPNLVLPMFSIAFLVGLIVVKIMNKTNASEYISKDTVDRISGSATDLLVAFGISSINLSVVLDNILPLSLLLIFGVIYCYVFFKIISKKFFKTYRFEKAIFTWGWSTGTVAMGIALLRIADPDNESGTLEDYGLAYILIAPIEVMLVTFAPLLAMMGYSYTFIGITFISSLIIYIMAKKLHWLPESKQVKTS